MEFGTIENLHLLIIAELELYMPYAMLNKSQIYIFSYSNLYTLYYKNIFHLEF